MSEIKQCQVMGPFNSGTSLMESYVARLFQQRGERVFRYWKHSLPPSYFHYPRQSGPPIAVDLSDSLFDGVLFICMVRSPYFWSRSTCIRGYNLSFNVRTLDFGARLRSSVVLRGNQRYSNIVQLWNHYYRAYAECLEIRGDVVYVRLEDLVENPQGTLRSLEEHLPRRAGSDLELVISKLFGEPMKKTNSAGLGWLEINTPEHLARALSSRDRDFITSQLDPSLMRKFGYALQWTPPDVH